MENLCQRFCGNRFLVLTMELDHLPKGGRLRQRYSWIELFSLSAVFHGLVVGLAFVLWIVWESGTGQGQPILMSGKGHAVCFWDDSKASESDNALAASKVSSKQSSDTVPFTVQMSPIGLAERAGPTSIMPESGAPSSSLMSLRGQGNWLDSAQLPEKTAWLIDCSLSMGIHAQFLQAQNQLLSALEQGNTLGKVRVWSFAQFAREVSGTGGWAMWTPDRHRCARADLAGVAPSGNTDLAGALRTVLATNPDLIQIITDEDLLSDRELAGLRRLQNRQAKPMPRLRVVVLTKPAGETPLQIFCRQAGCSYRVAPSSDPNRFR
jgi:hypothetical protein